MAERTRTPDKRVERSRSAILAETYRQLSRNGIGGVSIDTIARESGVSKMTIYRHWRSRSALLMDACASMRPTVTLPDTGNLRSDLLALLTGLVQQLETGVWSTVYPSILDATERDKEIAALQGQLHRSAMAPLESVLERAREHGDPALEGRVTSDLVASLVGPLVFRRWFSRETIETSFVAALVDAVLA